jgi:hypothetical protein
MCLPQVFPRQIAEMMLALQGERDDVGATRSTLTSAECLVCNVQPGEMRSRPTNTLPAAGR